jgi:dTDP-glucose pyrophosphorylase
MTTKARGWAEAILPTGSTLWQAVNVLNETSLKIILVVDANEILVGTISDGDIRRGLLKGLDLTNTIDSVINEYPLVVPPELSHDVVHQLMNTNKIQQIPIVDEGNRIIGLHLWDELSMPLVRANLMVIMAGGKGTRLHPETENCPKPLLPVAGKPILEHIIVRAKAEGFTHFILAIHHLGHMIEEYFGNGDALGVKIEYLKEEAPLGTAGALSLLDPLPGFPFIVTNGDVLTQINYGELIDFHVQYNAVGTMAVRVHEWQNPFGVVKTQGIEITGYEEKPLSRVHINAGVYVLDPIAIGFLTKSIPYDMPTLFGMIQENELRTIAYPIHEQWIDVGRPSDFLRANSGSLN